TRAADHQQLRTPRLSRRASKLRSCRQGGPFTRIDDQHLRDASPVSQNRRHARDPMDPDTLSTQPGETNMSEATAMLIETSVKNHIGTIMLNDRKTLNSLSSSLIK